MRTALAGFALILTFLIPATASAQASDDRGVSSEATFSFLPPADTPAQGQPRTKAFVYSDGYHTRAKIHRTASFASLPLFGAEALLGQSLYNSPSSGKRTAHIVVGSAIMGLFAVNSVTGVWNLVEARKDPKGRTLRWVHGLLMLGADVGFVATVATGPGNGKHNGVVTTETIQSRAATHRNVAIASLGVATLGYTIMLFGK
jgi:hypothetical protein